MQDTRHPMRRALAGARGERLISAVPPIKDPEMQAWLSPLAVRDEERTPARGPTAAASKSVRQGFVMSALAALAVGTLTWSMLPRSDDGAMLVAVDGASLEASMTPAAGVADPGAAVITDTLGIEEIELLLQKVAFQPGTIDGMLDDRTAMAIREYERASGREQTGLPTVALRDELRAVADYLASE